MRIDNFAGAIPKLDGTKLPENAGRVAHGCRIASGGLRLLEADSSFSSMHQDGVLIGDVDASEIVQITKPAAPTLSSRTWVCKPFDLSTYAPNWLRIYAYDWVSYINNSGVRVTSYARGQGAGALTVSSVEYTEAGMAIVAILPSVTHTFAKGYTYQLRGPRYQFAFSADVGGTNGGPASEISVPVYSTESDQQVTNYPVPLFNSDGELYGNFKISDYVGPLYDDDLYLLDYSSNLSYKVPYLTSAYVTFIVNLDYTEPRRKEHYYVQSMVTADDLEGPPSEISSKIIVRPGEQITLSTPRESGYTRNRLYRSGTGGDDFLLIDDVDADTFVDTVEAPQPVDLPTFGNAPTTPADFAVGSRWHPAHFALCYYGSNLYPSETYFPHIYPEEYTVPFQADIMGTAMTGNTLIVWTSDGYTYAVTGNNPAALTRYLLSKDAPLLDVTGIAQIGGTVYWVTTDGIAASNGGEVEIITDEFFTREQWQTLTPDGMKVTVANGALYVETSTFTHAFDGSIPDGEYAHLRFEIGKGERSLTSYDSTTSTSYKWQSRDFYYDVPKRFQWLQLDMESGSVDATLTVDGTSETHTISSSAPTEFSTLPAGKVWSVTLEGSGGVNSLDAFEEQSVNVGPGGVVLNKGDVRLWKNLRMKFQDRGVFAALSLDCSDYSATSVDFYDAATGNSIWSQTVTDGHAIRLPRTLAEYACWLVTVTTAGEVYQLVLQPLVEVKVDGNVSEQSDGSSIPPWMYRRYVHPANHRVASAMADASAAVTLRLFQDRDTSATATAALTSGVEASLSAEPDHTALEFDFDGDDYKVGSAEIYLSVLRPIQQDGQVVTYSGPNWRKIGWRFPSKGRVEAIMVTADNPVAIVVTVDGVPKIDTTLSDTTIYKVPDSIAPGAVWEATLTEQT